jgi:hypothetical protein
MVPWNKCLISIVVFLLAVVPVAGGGQAKTAAAPGAAAGAKPAGPEPCANEVVAATSQVGATATEMGKTADAVGTAGEKITKAFNSWKTPKPAAKPATTTAAATTPAKPGAAATPPKPAAAAAPTPAALASAVPAAAGSAGGAGGSGGGSAPCAPAKKELASGGPGAGPGGGPGEGKPGTPTPNPAPGPPIVIDAPPTFTAMPDGDVMLGYVAPGAAATTYAKVKMLPAATPPPATSPHDGTYTDGKMFYTVGGGKMFLTPVAGATAGAPGATAVAAKPAPVSGLVADVSGTTLIINIGTNSGVKVGTTLDVVRPRVIKDPTTHKDLKTVDTNLGSLTITSADATTATGSFKGTTPTKVGDTVKTPE